MPVIIILKMVHYMYTIMLHILSTYPNANIVYIGGLYDYPLAPDWDHYVDQSNNPKVCKQTHTGYH